MQDELQGVYHTLISLLNNLHVKFLNSLAVLEQEEKEPRVSYDI